MDDFWLKQTDEPLWPELQWSRPQQKRLAKKLLIVGGYEQGFNAVGRLYQAALDAGIGAAKVALPSSLKRTVGSALPDAVFTELAPEPSHLGPAKTELMAYADWADGVVFAQTGNNSKTALLLADFIGSYGGPLVAGDELAELLKHDTGVLAGRKQTLFCFSFDGLQRWAAHHKSEVGFRHDMGLRPFVLALRQLNQYQNQPLMCIYEQQVVVVADGGRVVSTPRQQTPDPIALAGFGATWWLQQPGKTLEALATAAFEF
jgi:hypothetical protein